MEITIENITDMLTDYIDQEREDGKDTHSIINVILLEIFEYLWVKKEECEKLDREDRADADFESHDY